MLGNGRLEALCFDGEKRLAHIRGKLRKKVTLMPHHLSLTIFNTGAPLGLDQSRRYHSFIPS